ncbi:MAG: hypothetical protein ACP5N1_00495 [Candidatus Woesearchaeota archaeon]
MRRKGAIELSANFLVVIIISLIVVVGGLALFFNLKNNLDDYKGALDSQTEENIKQMMLSNSYRVAVYPSDLKISNGDSALVGVGVTNINSNPMEFDVKVMEIKHYITSTDDGTILPTTNGYVSMVAGNMKLAGGSQGVKGILLKIPGNAAKGQYVYTIKVLNFANTDVYGTVQVYVTN